MSIKLCVIGTGYVGLVSAVCFAEKGFEVVCVDSDVSKLEKISNQKSPIFEPDLEELLVKNTSRIKTENNLFAGVETSNIIFLALPTPPNEDGSCDLRIIKSVCQKIADSKISLKDKIFVNKSTVPIGTGKQIQNILGEDCVVVSNPEFLREGFAVHDFLFPDRIVIGLDSNDSNIKRALDTLYESFECPTIYVSIHEAELVKYIANSYLATRLSFINEVASLCEKLNTNVNEMSINVENIIQGVGMDKRIGTHYFSPSLGYGGSCLPKDTLSLQSFCNNNNFEFNLLNASIKVNNDRKQLFIQKLNERFGENFPKRIGILGLSFKANTDDIRFSPCIELIDFLLKKNVIVNVHDPEANSNIEKLYGKQLTYDFGSVLTNEVIVILTDWEVYKNKEFYTDKIVFDSRNMFRELKNSKEYYSIGRPTEFNDLL